MKARVITRATTSGTARKITFVGIALALTAFAGVGLATSPTWAEVGTKLQKERAIAESNIPVEKTTYTFLGAAQFFGPPAPEKAATNDGFRFIHTDPHLHDGHRASHGGHHNANIADGGALMFNWAFDK